MKSITIPSNVTTIGDSAFKGCGLESIVIPDTVTSLGEYAFNACPSLKDVTLSRNASFTTIKYQTFDGCVALESIVIPANITTVKANVFNGCTSLKTVTFLRADKTLELQSGAFRDLQLDHVYTVLSESDYNTWSHDGFYIWDNNNAIKADVATGTTFHYGYVEP